MRIKAYELANRIMDAEDESGIEGLSMKSGVSVASLEAIWKDSSISPGNLAKMTEYLGHTQPAYYEYVPFAIRMESMISGLQQIGFVPGDEKEGIGALRWVDPTGEKRRVTYNYAVSLSNNLGSGYVVVASDKSYHEACNIAYLQAAVLGWEAK